MPVRLFRGVDAHVYFLLPHAETKQRTLHAEQNKPPVDEQRKKIKKLLMANAEQRLIYAKEYTVRFRSIPWPSRLSFYGFMLMGFWTFRI